MRPKLKKASMITALICGITLVGCNGESSSGISGLPAGKNIDNSFAMITTWTSSGIINHYNSNTAVEAFNYFVVEGLYAYVRSSDEVYAQLADGMPVHSEAPISTYINEMGTDAYQYYIDLGYDTVSVSTVNIREDAKWHNGEDFTARDVWSYYYMIHPTSSNYMVAVKVVSPKSVQFVWSPIKEPNDKVKTLLISQDKSGTMKYDEFSHLIDEMYDLVLNSPINENQNMWGAFNRFSNPDQISRRRQLITAMRETNPSWYLATGPFKLSTFSPTQILLVKNDYYWNAKNIGFERIKLYSANDLNQTYNLISNNYIDYYDGFIQQDTLQSMLDTNKDLINLKMYDPGAIGLTFNIKSPLLGSKVREAFQYIFDRGEIMLSSNPYAIISNYPVLGMAPSEAKLYMSEEHFNNLPKFEKNHARAEQLLTEAGWTKAGGRWSAGGRQVELNFGAPSNHDISSTAAEAVAAQLESFGIKINLLKSSSFHSIAREPDKIYDLMLQFSDLNVSFSYPTGSYSQFAGVYSHWANVDRYPSSYPEEPQKAGNVNMTFPGLDGDMKTYEFADYINSFYSLDEEELEYLVDVFNTGIASQNLGVQFFQNVTASTLNIGRIKGIPLEEYWSVDRNVTYVPEVGTEDFFEVARTNLVFAKTYMLAYGIYQPNKPAN